MALNNGLVLSFSLETNAIVDDTGVHDGSTFNTTLVAGRNGNGLNYNGTNAYSTVPIDAAHRLTQEFTLMCDIYPTAVGQSSVSLIFGRINNTGGGTSYSISYRSTGVIRGRFASAASTWHDHNSTETLTLNAWNRVVVRYKNGETIRVRVNAAATESAVFNLAIHDHATESIALGAFPTGYTGASNRRFQGRLDNAMLWNRRLTDAEVDELVNDLLTYNDINPPNESNISGNLNIPAITSTAEVASAEPIFEITGATTIPLITSTAEIGNIAPVYAISGGISIPPITSTAEFTNVSPVYSRSGSPAIPVLTSTGIIESIAPTFEITGAVSIGLIQSIASVEVLEPSFSITGDFQIPQVTSTAVLETTIPVYAIEGVVAIGQITSEASLLSSGPVFSITGDALIPQLVTNGSLSNVAPIFSVTGDALIPQLTTNGVIENVVLGYTLSGDILIPQISANGSLVNVAPEFILNGEATTTSPAPVPSTPTGGASG